jgi:hypothetical protein
LMDDIDLPDVGSKTTINPALLPYQIMVKL